MLWGTQQLLMFLLLLGLLSSSNAQEKVEWAPLGATWHYRYFGVSGDRGYSYMKMESLIDTVIQGQESRIVEQTIVRKHEDAVRETTRYRIPLSQNENGDSLFYFINGKFRLLYDFSAKLGDTIKVYNPLWRYSRNKTSVDSTTFAIVDSVKTIELNGQLIKAHYYSTLRIGAKYYGFGGWVYQGIGGFNQFFPLTHGLDCDGGCAIGLRCYRDDNFFHQFSYVPCDYLVANEKPIFIDMEASPNPFTNYIEINGFDFNNQGKSTYRIVDLSGRTVLRGDLYREKTISTKDLQSGTYILQVKNRGHLWQKMMVKY